MRRIACCTLLAATLALGGCTGMTDTQQSTLSGGAMGAAGGALIGALSGSAMWGAVAGGGAGLIGGYLYGQHRESVRDAYRRGRADGQRQQ